MLGCLTGYFIGQHKYPITYMSLFHLKLEYPSHLDANRDILPLVINTSNYANSSYLFENIFKQFYFDEVHFSNLLNGLQGSEQMPLRVRLINNHLFSLEINLPQRDKVNLIKNEVIALLNSASAAKFDLESVLFIDQPSSMLRVYIINSVLVSTMLSILFFVIYSNLGCK
jgi:hypothetical protein